ncbi:MAG: antibiotic biosynthesis monooxygenase family protein [bacterium]
MTPSIESQRGGVVEFVSRSEITVPVPEMIALERAFEARARLVDGHAGFLGLELLRDIRENGRYVLVTRWRTRSDFSAYMKSGDHARAHDRHHEGLGPVGPGKLEQFHSVLEVRAATPGPA